MKVNFRRVRFVADFLGGGEVPEPRKAQSPLDELRHTESYYSGRVWWRTHNPARRRIAASSRSARARRSLNASLKKLLTTQKTTNADEALVSYLPGCCDWFLSAMEIVYTVSIEEYLGCFSEALLFSIPCAFYLGLFLI